MDKREQSSDSVAKWCVSSVVTGVSGNSDGAVPNVGASLEEAAQDDCCSESHLRSSQKKKLKRTTDNSICIKGDEQTPGTSTATESNNDVVSSIAELQSFGSDDSSDLDIHKKSASMNEDDADDEKPTCSRYARREGRNSLLIPGENEDDNTTAGDNYVNLENTPSRSEEPQRLPMIEASNDAPAPMWVAKHDSCIESNSRSTATENEESVTHNEICSRDDEQASSTRAALKSDTDIISPMFAALETLERVFSNANLEIATSSASNYVDDADDEKPTCSRYARPKGRNFRLFLDEDVDDNNISLENSPSRKGRNFRLFPDDDKDDNTAAGDNNISLENSPSRSVELQPSPLIEDRRDSGDSDTNTGYRSSFDRRLAHAFPGNDYITRPQVKRQLHPNTLADREREKLVRNLLSKPKPPYEWNLDYQLISREHRLTRDGRHFRHGTLESSFSSSRQVVERMGNSGRLQTPLDIVKSLHLDRPGNLLCSGFVDNGIIVFDWAKGTEKIAFYSNRIGSITAINFIDSSGHLDIVSAYEGGEIYRSIISLAGGDPETTMLYHHDGPVHKIVTNPFNSFEMFSVGEDGHIRFKDLRSNDPNSSICEVKKNESEHLRLFSIAHHPKSPEICVSGADKFVRVYDKRNMTKTVSEMCPLHLIKESITQVPCAVYNSTGTEVLASYFIEDIYLFNNIIYSQGEYLHRYFGHRNNRTLRKEVKFFGPNSDYVICGSDCGNIFLWHKNGEAIVNLLPTDEEAVNYLQPHPRFPELASGGNGNVKIWTPCRPTYAPDLSNLAWCVKQNMRLYEHARRYELDGRRAVRENLRHVLGIDNSEDHISQESHMENHLQ